MVLSVTVGAVLSGFGVYDMLVKLGGAGATVPLPGFGHALVQGMLEGAREGGFVGMISGGLKATSLGLSVAILLGFFLSLIFDPRG